MKPVFSSLPALALAKVGATTGLFFVVLLSLSAQNRYYVNAAATGANTGQSWTDAFPDLQAALQTAQTGDEVWVAKGTYYPTDSTDRKVSFEPASGTKLYGGFAGIETSLGQRDWMAHPVVLSGDIGILGDSTDNVYNVVYLLEPDTNTLLDGFVIRDGVANNGGAIPSRDRKRCGGGLYIMGENADAYPDIRNCVFIHNSATAFGGGVMMNGGGQGSVAPRFVNCRFEQNHAVASGGGAARFGGSWIERGDDFAGCVFLRNRADYRGGGFYYTDTERNDRLDIHGCSFQENRAVEDGGGAYLNIGRLNPSGFTFISTSFIGNIAGDGGAFIARSENILNVNFFDIDSCEFIGNVLIVYNSPQPAVVKMEFNDGVGGSGLIRESTFIENDKWNCILNIEWPEKNNFFLNKGLFWSNKQTQYVFKTSEITNVFVVKSEYSQNIFTSLICLNLSKKVSYENCIFNENKSGAGYYILTRDGTVDTLTLSNCTFANNMVGQTGAMNINYSVKSAYNCILSGINNLYRFFRTNNYGEYSYCSFDSIDCALLPPNIHCGPGNIVGLDPMFRDTANHDFSLLPCSPLINAGSNAAAAGILTDLAGNPRIQEGRVDIGAYEAPAFSLAAIPEVKPACVGSSNGSITVNPVMGCEPYHYDWSPQAGNGPELNGLPPGNYRLTITDGSGRQILDTVQVAAAPIPVLNPVVSDVQCITGLGGSISAGTSSGTAPFHYQWLPSAADTASLHHLSPGAYALTVVDANGCQDSASASISLSGMLTLMVGGQGIPCYGETGWLSATPLTGAAPFHWLWQGWPGTDSIAQPLSPGVYAVTVSDTYGCTAAFAFPPMTQPDSLWATVGTSPQTDLNMPNGAAIVTTISGGSSPFGFEWNTGNTTQALTGIAAGTYTVTVEDKNGCEAVVEVVVDLMVGTNEAEGQALLLYPNPAADWLKVVLPASSAAHWVELSDASGRVLRSALLPTATATATATANCQLDLRGLPSGGYWVRVRNGAGKEMFVGKVLKM